MWIERNRTGLAQLFDMLARMSTSVSIAGFACRICRRALRRIDQMMKAGPDGRSP
jgi:hypothetical protein